MSLFAYKGNTMPPASARPPKSRKAPATPPDLVVAGRFLSWILTEHGCFEIRAIKSRISYETKAIVRAGRHSTLSGFYDNVHDACVDIQRVEGTSLYVTINPVDRALMGRLGSNEIRESESATSDENVSVEVKVLIDIDSVRPADISATDDQVADVMARLAYLLEHEPAIAAASHWGCSGNGAWCIAEIAPVSPAEGLPMVERFLKHLSTVYSTETVNIDSKVRNASRIGPIPGTFKCKGSSIADRPWRMITMESADRPLVPLDLAAYVAALPLPPPPEVAQRARKGLNGHVAILQPPPGQPAAALNGQPVRPDVEDRVKRATAYLSAMPPAVEGQNGHGRTFDAACAVIKGFDLSPGDAFGPLSCWNQGCQPPWDDADLWHKLHDADKKPDTRIRGYLYDADHRPDQGQFEGGFEAEGEPAEAPKTNEITWNPVELLVNDQVITHLNKFPGLYQKDCMLVEIVRKDAEAAKIKFLEIPPGTPMIVVTNTHRLREIISRVVSFRQKIEGKARMKSIHVPDRCVTAVHSRSEWRGLPQLVGVVEHPILRPDGSITEKPGYDPDTGMFWMGDPIRPVPESPTRQEVWDAADKLLDLISEFEFEDDISRSVWLACLLTILVRHMINGDVPLFYFDASTAGSGKTLLCDAISCIVTGREMTRTEYHHDAVEMGKRIVSILIAGIRVTMLDNIEGEFGNAALDNVLTARYYSGRILGLSKMSPPLLVDTTFIATSNNAIFCGDLYRRVLTSRLVSSCERPDQERVKFKIPDLIDHIKKNRSELLCAALTILRGYIQAGCPHDLPTNVYGNWTRVVRGAVKWAIGLDPWANQAKSVQSDSRRSGISALLDAYAEMLTHEKEDTMSTSEILRALHKEQLDESAHAMVKTYQSMHDAIMESWADRSGRLPSAGTLGKKMTGINMTRYGNYRLVKREDAHSGVHYWGLQKWEAGTWVNFSSPKNDHPNLAQSNAF